MINMLLGLPGGGKSYEAVVFHILPALANGRKVITNLPLNLETIGALHPEYLPLLEIRTATLKPRPPEPPQGENPYGSVRFNATAFANVEDYGDPWRHPESGAGPLYVVDECHISLPKIGTPVKVEEWYSMHRHEFADVLLITQTYGKINQAIREIVQVVYRVKKATAFGFNSKYIRKVQDGLRGEVVNTSIRAYKPENYKFYNSHTKSGAGAEQHSNDIRPLWKNWTFVGAGMCALIILGMVFTMDVKDPFNANSHVKNASPKAPPVPTSRLVGSSPDPVSIVPASAPSGSSAPETPVENEATQLDPFKGKSFHLLGRMTGRKDGAPFNVWMFAVSQNGQRVTTMSDDQLKPSGYVWEPHSDCSGFLHLGKITRPITCDAPLIQIIPASQGSAA